jgi:branched-chain amino acid transport system permease protein
MSRILNNAWNAIRPILETPVGLILIVAYLAGVALLLNSDPTSLLYRMMLMVGVLLIYFVPQKMWVRVMLAAIVMLIIIPIFGIRNPFLLELGFQIAIFSALALGLNVVVGFAGLLDLGYIAFFAVGAYTWGFFG